MLRTLTLSLGQLGDRAILAVLAKSLALTLAIFALVFVGYWYAAEALLAAVSTWHDGVGLLMLAALVLAALTAWFLFRAVAIAVLGVFADDVVVAVEARHYPAALKTARAVGWARAAAMGLRSAARTILVNAALLPLYLAALFTAVGLPILFFAVNGWLLGRDLGEMVAARHLDPAAMRGWRRASRWPDTLLGLAVTALFMVPVVNLLAPVIGAAMATHRFHAARAKGNGHEDLDGDPAAAATGRVRDTGGAPVGGAAGDRL